jgi:hypothetical protein
VIDLVAARAYALAHPTDTRQRTLLELLDPAPANRPPLNIAAARAARAATLAAASPPAAPASPPPARREILLDVGAARARAAAAEAARRPPLAPPSAMRFVAGAGGGSWRWAHIDPRLPSARRWLRLAASLVAAGPLLSLHVEQAVSVGQGGHTAFRDGDGGAMWASIAIDPDVCGTHHRAERVLAHEFAHVADELAALQRSASASSWRRAFDDPHRTVAAEEFAVAAEEWVTPQTPAAELLDAARRHQEQRRA